MVVEYFAVPFVTTTYAKTISLSIKPAVRFWRQKHSSVYPVTGWDSIHAYAVRLVSAMTTLEAKYLKLKKENHHLAPSVDMKLKKRRI